MTFSRSRDNRISQLWRFLTNLGNRPKPAEIAGSKRPRSRSALRLGGRREFDLEIDQVPIRNAAIARKLLEMQAWGFEPANIARIMAQDVLMSVDGDDMGWTIADTLDDNETPVNEEAKAILMDLLKRRRGRDRVIGGLKLQRMVEEGLLLGDSFLNYAIENDGTGPNGWGVVRAEYLPVFEIFSCEDESHELSHYEQRERIDDNNPLIINPVLMAHFAFDKQSRYGRSLWQQSVPAWDELKEATFDYGVATRALAVDPTIHTMPDTYSEEDKETYAQDIELERSDGIITDFFLMNGAQISKLGNNPNLKPLSDRVLEKRMQLVPPGFPLWMLPGLSSEGRAARELSGQPALAYCRRIYHLRALLTEQIKWICDVELILKKGWEWYTENGDYRIVFPPFSMEIYQAQQINLAESNAEGVTDLDEADDVTGESEAIASRLMASSFGRSNGWRSIHIN